MTKVCIVGGGVIGLCSAYYLNQAGHTVTVIDAGESRSGCSTGNAGMIVPSHFVPLAAPGMISKGIRWMFDSKSPFYVKPRWNTNLFRWGYQFYKHSTSSHVQGSVHALAEFSLFSKECYRQLALDLPFDFGFKEKGLLMLFQTVEAEREERHTVKLAHELGMEAEFIGIDEIQKLEPGLEVSARGGVYFRGDAHLTPQEFVEGLRHLLTDNGVRFLKNTTVVDFNVRSGRIQSAKTKAGEVTSDEWILATGAWSGQLAATLKLRLPVQAGKGYSFTLNDVEKNIQIPTIFLEARVAVTPMGRSLRFGGTMEFSGLSSQVNMNRVKGIVESIPVYYPGMKVEIPKESNVWYGFRPCSPDGLPYIGRSKKVLNLVIATGHAMMGLSLGPATGKVVASMVDGKSPEVDVARFDPERFAGSV